MPRTIKRIEKQGRETMTRMRLGYALGGLAALGALSAVLLVYRVLIVLPSPTRVIDQKLGAFLGLLCALGIAWGGYEAIREQRARVRAAGATPRRRRPHLPSRRSQP